MKNDFNQLKTDCISTEKKSIFMKSISILFIIIFLFFPLAEIITEFDYNYSVSYSSYSCMMDF
jgi:hypothetical protein